MGRSSESSIVTKCARVMDVLSQARQPLAFAQIVEHTGFVKSSCHRILAVLQSERLVQYDKETRTYQTGTRLRQWAQSSWRRIDLQQIASGVMGQLTEATGMNTALSVLDDQSILYLCTEDHIPLRYAAHAGDHAPLHCTAAGKVFLAYLPEARKEALLQNLPFEKFTEFTMTSAEELRRALWDVQTQGYARAFKEEFLQVLGLAAPVFNEQGKVVACLSLWATEKFATAQEVIAQSQTLIASAKEISTGLGWDPVNPMP